jgi:O-antigen ligase
MDGSATLQQPGALGWRGPRPAGAPARVATPWSFPLLLGFLLLMFSNAALLAPELAALAPAQLAAMAAVALLLAERTLSRAGLQLVDPESYLLALLLIVATVSSFTALWPRYALENTAKLLKFAIVYLLLVNTVESWRRFDTTVKVLAIGGLFPALGALHNLYRGEFVEGSRVAWIGIFGNPNDLAYTLAVLLPLVILLALEARGWPRAFYWAIVTVYAVAAFATYSRGGMLGLLAAGGLCFLRWSQGLQRLAGLGAGGLAMLAMASFWRRDEGFDSLAADATVLERLATIRGGLEMFVERPVLGVGPGCSVLGWEAYAPADSSWSTHWLHVHNTYVQALCEVGLLGATAFFLFLGVPLLRAHRLARRWRLAGCRPAERRATALAIAMWGLLVCGLSGGHLLSALPYLVVGLISALHLLPQPAPVWPGTRDAL